MSYQERLGVDTSGFVTSYWLEDVGAAVLSIPSFEEHGDGIGTFSRSILHFVGNATAADRRARSVIIGASPNGLTHLVSLLMFRQISSKIPVAQCHWLSMCIGTFSRVQHPSQEVA